MAFSFGSSPFSTPNSGGGGFSFGAPTNNNSTFNTGNNGGGGGFSFGLPSTPNTNSTFGSFGQNNTNSTFGGGTTFGTPNNNNSTFGSFNASNPPPAPFGSPSFGGGNTFSTPSFGGGGGGGNMFGGGGGIGGGPAYKPSEIREAANSPAMQYLHVCAMDAYKNYSIEFLRWSEYKKGPQPQAQSSPMGSFNTGGTTFGQPSNNTTPSFSFGGNNNTGGTTFGTNNQSSPSFSFNTNKTNTGTPSFSFGNQGTGGTTFGSNTTPSFSTPSSTPSFSFGNTTSPSTGSTFSFGNTTTQSNNSGSTFSFGNSTTPSGSSFSFGNNNSTSPSFSFGNTANKSTFSLGNTNSTFSLSPTGTNTTGGFFSGGFSGGNAQQQQQQKVELAMSHEPYGKLPDIPVPVARVKALPTTPTVGKPLTPTSASQYKLTPKSVKKLMIGMEQAPYPATADIDQRVINELISPQSNFKRLVITQEDQNVFDSARKQQKAVLRDLSNEPSFPTSASFMAEQEYSPYKQPVQTSLPNSKMINPTITTAASSALHKSAKSPLIAITDDDAMQAEVAANQLQTPLRHSTKGSDTPGLSLSSLANSYKPTPIRAQPSGSHYQNPLAGLTDSQRARSGSYASYTEAMVDNRPEADIDKSVPVPKCTRVGVQLIPSMDTLLRMTKAELMRVKDFTVAKDSVGKVTFVGFTDVRGLDIDKIVLFKEREIVIYPSEDGKPPVGQGLNKPAEITLYRCWPIDKVTNRPTDEPDQVAHFTKLLQKRCKKWGCEFVSYENGHWTFRLEHFAE